jgi:Fic family protein
MRMGEAYSKCFHLAGTPLKPDLAANLARVYMVKGVAATTAIEGNTLTEQEVAEVLENDKSLPDSQQYLATEVRNVRRVLENIDVAASKETEFTLTAAWLKAQNRLILDRLDVAEHVTPGAYTESTLVVGGAYRGAPPEDVPYLVDRLCEWVNQRLHDTQQYKMSDEYRFSNTVTTAILAHLYLVWIHPFGDGNGRTARALECAILATSGLVPWVSSNLLSDYYNRTRSLYYKPLAEASRKNDVQGFIDYALQGFVELLREQIREVQSMQRQTAWTNFVHEVFQSETQGEASRRRRALVLAMPADTRTMRGSVRRLTPELAELYAGRADKTITHDINKLLKLGLIEGAAQTGYVPRINRMDAFLPANLHLRRVSATPEPVSV